jgi:hypothetical protein
VHALRKVHAWMRTDGLLLDLHPEPEHFNVDVVLPRATLVHVGQLDTTALSANIRAARAALTALLAAGWFRPERSMLFDFVSRFSSVDQWLRHREEQRCTSVVAPEIVLRARDLLTAAGGELRVAERVLATRLTRGVP